MDRKAVFGKLPAVYLQIMPQSLFVPRCIYFTLSHPYCLFVRQTNVLTDHQFKPRRDKSSQVPRVFCNLLFRPFAEQHNHSVKVSALSKGWLGCCFKAALV